MKILKIKKLLISSMLFIGVLVPSCMSGSIQVLADTKENIIEIEENNFDFWGDKNSLSKIPDFDYTKTGIHIKTTEKLLDTIKTNIDCDTLAEKVLNEFKEKNGFAFARTLTSVSNEIYFHIQMEKYARIKNDTEVHNHTNIIDMDGNEKQFDSFIIPDMTDLLTEKNISSDYEIFIKKFK